MRETPAAKLAVIRGAQPLADVRNLAEKMRGDLYLHRRTAAETILDTEEIIRKAQEPAAEA